MLRGALCARHTGSKTARSAQLPAVSTLRFKTVCHCSGCSAAATTRSPALAGRWSSRCYCAVQACHGRYPPVDHTNGAIGIIHKDRKSPRLRSRPRRSSSARMFIQMRTQAAAHLLTMHMSMQNIEMHCARSIMHVIAILWPNRCPMTHTVWSPRNSQRGMTHAASAALCAHRRNVQPNRMN